MSVVYLMNNIAVGIFGIILSCAFCDIVWTRKKYRILLGSTALLLMIQGIVYFFIDPQMAKWLYPFTTHLPLAVMLWALSKKCLWSVISVMTAYLCCQIRRWIALLFTFVLSGTPAMECIIELIVTLPLLLLLRRIVAPAVRSVSRYNIFVQCQFGWIPVLYYFFDYLTMVYTNLLLAGATVVVEFMPFVCCMAYLLFVLHISEAEQARSRLEQTQEGLNIQIAQAVREIEALRESRQKAVVYRHDLHHHMQYLSTCIENGKTEQAQTYIQEICSEIKADKITVYCENEVTNLILSSFVRSADEQDIPIKIKAAISRSIHVSETDLCVLLSNALENAMHACQKQKEKGLPGMIEVSAYDRSGKFFLQIINSCDDNIRFEHGIPVSDTPGHGIGVRSICAIVEKYDGIYTFLVEDNWFIVRVSL